jgi:hypothetical protein
MKSKNIFYVISTILLAGLLVLTACPETDENVTKHYPIGEITGTITLTDIAAPAPKVFISVEGIDGGKQWSSNNSQINLISGSVTLADISWSIPIYEENDFFASTGNFRLYIQPNGSKNVLTIDIPNAKDISGANADVGSLGSVSIKYITLSGTVNVTYNGQAAPNVKIFCCRDYNDPIDMTASVEWIGSVELTSPGNNAKWSISLLPLESSIQVYFVVRGYSANWNEELFYKEITPSQEINAYNADVSGINLNVGNIEYTPINPLPLTANTWKDGEITDIGDVDWYSIKNVTSGTTYYLWWNEVYAGDSSKSLDIEVCVYDSDINLISLTNNDVAWSVPASFTASSTGTFYVKVSACKVSDPTGTYAIVYGKSNIRPDIPIKPEE